MSARSTLESKTRDGVLNFSVFGVPRMFGAPAQDGDRNLEAAPAPSARTGERKNSSKMADQSWVFGTAVAGLDVITADDGASSLLSV